MAVAVVLVLLCLFLFGLAVGGLLLWLATKLCRVPQVTYRRALLTVILSEVLQIAVGLLGLYALPRSGNGVAPLLLMTLVSLVIPFVCIEVFLKTSLGKTLLVGLLWNILGAVCAVVIVLAIRFSLTEGFVIPTGGMAETLWGYHKMVTCPKCDHRFPINCSAEGDPGAGPPTPITACTCPNCRYHIDFSKDGMRPVLDGGDRFLAAKGLLDRTCMERKRLVFHYPPSQGQNGEAIKYVKRLVGLPGETVGIHYGKLYALGPDRLPPERKEKYERDRSGSDAQELWRSEHMHAGDLADLLREGSGAFQIIQKTPDKVLALRRLVYDNDHPPKDLAETLPQRWAGVEDGVAWSAIEPHGFRAAPGDRLAWLRYRHILRPPPDVQERSPKPQLITDFLGYNTYEPHRGFLFESPWNWVGDLMLECEVTVEQPGGELVLELSKGVERYRVGWDLATGTAVLLRLDTANKESKPPADSDFKELGSKPTALKGKGTHRLRFANVDNRLTVWVDDSLPFGEGVSYEPFAEHGPYANDLQPVSIGVRGGMVRVHKLKLWRDTYFTTEPGRSDAELPVRDMDGAEQQADLHKLLSNPEQWARLRDLPAKTGYVQPGHYFFLGDNSPESSDSRVWGLVPERLLVGRALLLYYPFNRAGRIE